MPANEAQEDADAARDRISIVLADDHEVVRDGIRLVLESEADIEVVAEASTADDAARYALGHKPAVVMLDLNMPGTPSLDMIAEIKERSPESAVLILTMQNEPAFAREALQRGAAGFVIKHSAARELVDAVRAVVKGETYINPQLGAKVAATPDPPDGPPDDLTPREVEILGLIALGFMNPEIAEQLVLSVRTVETHRANIQRKTGVTTRAELIAYALDNGLVER